MGPQNKKIGSLLEARENASGIGISFIFNSLR